jgi:mannose-1-phosphate guanylyltransferase
MISYDMVVIIIAGGAGTRLWPLSTPKNPKHLLKLGAETRTLLQQTYDRALLLTRDIYVVTEARQIDKLKLQLPGLNDDNYIVEPAPRGTANCLISALIYVEKKYDKTETIALMHADHYVRDLRGFVNSFKLAEEIAASSKRIVLMGVEPDKPSTKFGYIEKSDPFENQNYVYKVKSFKEKPDLDTAKRYLLSGKYLWNCGYFIADIKTFIKSIQDYAPQLYTNYLTLFKSNENEYEANYNALLTEAIDYALIEKTKNLLVVAASFDWMDLGSFNDLSSVLPGDSKGNSLLGQVVVEGVNNSFVQNYENKPMVVIGLDDVVVINNKDGILVLHKDHSQKVGDIAKKITNNN